VVRRLLALVLLVVVAACVYLAIAVPEAPSDSRQAFWLIYSLVGLLCLLGAGWLLLPKRPRS
jgi:hypothetical protein